jgi:hypothetical protein
MNIFLAIQYTAKAFESDTVAQTQFTRGAAIWSTITEQQTCASECIASSANSKR